MPKNALHDYEQLFFSTAEILQSTISNFSCVQSFWFTILTQKSIKTTYLLGTRTDRPGKLRVIGALCCGRVNWEPLHPVLQKLHAVVSPPANPKRYSRDGTASECNASAGCSKTAWRRHRRTPRAGHPGCGNSRCARERRHHCEDIQNTNKLRFFEIALQMRARQGHVEILIHVLAFENLIWDVVPPDASGKPCVNWDL
jgi:hypothetical protein